MPHVHKTAQMLIGIVCLLLVLTSSSTTTIRANTTGTLKVLSYNVEVTSESGPLRPGVARAIAYLIKDGGYDVALLQEVQRPSTNGWSTIDEALEIQKELTAAGYSMYLDYSNYTHSTAPDYEYRSLVIFSRYPLTGQRDASVARSLGAEIDTQFGKIWVFSIHQPTGQDGKCERYNKYLTQLEKYAGNIRIFAGDFNFDVRNSCVNNKLAPQYVFSCTDAGGKVSHKCLPSFMSGMLDAIGASTAGSVTMRESQTIQYNLSDHLAVSATIELPIVQSETKQGDLDRDGDVDIFDYNSVLDSFGKTGTAGFHPADIIKDGKIDVFDYNALLQNFQK